MYLIILENKALKVHIAIVINSHKHLLKSSTKKEFNNPDPLVYP